MSCCQVECLDDHTKIVPFTYHQGDDIDIQFRREEFCLITGLRFGVDFSSLYLKGHIPFMRRVFDSAMDGYHITARMLEAKIMSEHFCTINDHDAVSLCLLAILELVLLGQEPRHNVPDWCLRLVNDRKAWDMYPWGSYVWPTLYSSLRNASVKRWPVFYATPVKEGGGDPPKYTLSGFTWAFKYVTRNTGKGRNNEENADSYEGLRRNTYDSVTPSYGGVDINTLTMEQYLALSRENQASGVVKPEIGGNVNFEIKSQFMRELREETFSENKNEDAHDHVGRVLNIVSLFNIPWVSQDIVLLRVFPFTLTGTAKRWVDRLTPGAVNTWDLLKKAFIQRYCPPSKTAKRLEDIHNFKQEIDESLYQAWEQFNDLLYKCPTHDINSHQMWHDGTLSRSLSSNSNIDGLAAIVSKLDNLGRDMKKLKENVHAIQVGCQICEGPHLDKECPLIEEVKQVEEAKYREFSRPAPFNRSNGAKYRVGPPGYYTRTDNQPPYGEKRPSLEELMNNHLEESARRSTKMNEWINKL
ncbi:zinc knuckle CX2CX4HX4C containing protein [Tanacetum coccineum]